MRPPGKVQMQLFVESEAVHQYKNVYCGGSVESEWISPNLARNGRFQLRRKFTQRLFLKR